MEKITARKFVNLVSKTLGYAGAVALGQDAKWSAMKLGYAYLEEELDGSFLIANLKGHHAAKLIEAGFSATAKIASKRTALEDKRVELFWTAPAK
jgi:hypothetical protein